MSAWFERLARLPRLRFAEEFAAPIPTHIKLDVDGIEEISWWIMGYGDQAVVSEPEILRLLIQSHAKNLLRHYENNERTPVTRN